MVRTLKVVSPRNPYPAMIGSEVWKARYKAIFLFPLSLIYVCRFVLLVIEDSSYKSSAKVLTFHEKKKETARNVSVADEK